MCAHTLKVQTGAMMTPGGLKIRRAGKWRRLTAELDLRGSRDSLIDYKTHSLQIKISWGVLAVGESLVCDTKIHLMNFKAKRTDRKIGRLMG